MNRPNGPASAGPFSFVSTSRIMLLASLCIFECFSTEAADQSRHVQQIRNSLVTDSAVGRLVLRIGTRDSLPRGHFDTIDITLDGNGPLIAGFSLKVASTSPDLQIVQIVQGELLDSCSWEYFVASALPTENIRPATVWRFSGLAKFSVDTVAPACLSLGKRTSIARIIVATGNASTMNQDAFPAPLFFFWEDCRDNTVSDAGGRQLFVSERVIDYVITDWPAGLRQFPNRSGAPPGCVSPTAPNAPKRLVEFHNGGYVGANTETK